MSGCLSVSLAALHISQGQIGEKPAFLYLLASCPPSHLLLRWSEFLLKPEQSEVILRQELFGPLREQFESQFGFPLRPRQFESQFGFPLRPKQFGPQLRALNMGAKQKDRGDWKVLQPNLHPQDISLAYFAERKRATQTLLLPISLAFYRTGLIVKQYYT